MRGCCNLSLSSFGWDMILWYEWRKIVLPFSPRCALCALPTSHTLHTSKWDYYLFASVNVGGYFVVASRPHSVDGGCRWWRSNVPFYAFSGRRVYAENNWLGIGNNVLSIIVIKVWRRSHHYCYCRCHTACHGNYSQSDEQTRTPGPNNEYECTTSECKWLLENFIRISTRIEQKPQQRKKPSWHVFFFIFSCSRRRIPAINSPDNDERKKEQEKNVLWK